MAMDKVSTDDLDKGLDLGHYYGLFIRWWWLIFLSVIIASVVGFSVSRLMTPYYQASSVILVNEAPANKSTDYSSVMLSEQLATTYSQMIARNPIISQVAEQLGVTEPLDKIKEWISVTKIRDTQLIQVSAETKDPQLSADFVNNLVTVFSVQIQEIQAQRFAQSKSTLETQLADIEKEISNYNTQAQKASLDEEKVRLDAKVTQYREIYSNLLLSYEQIRLSEAQAMSSVVIIEPAIPDLDPVRPKVLLNTLLAGLFGLILSAGAIIARDALDDTVRSPEDITRKFDLPILGMINHHEPEVDVPTTISDPRSPTAEAYRSLRTNLNYISVDREINTLMITSAEPGEGKSTTISNLGVVMAQGGKKVIIADCDLRLPDVHNYFGLPNRHGLSTLFAESTDLLMVTLQTTQVENLSIITTGSLPPNPSELIGSRKMQTILQSMRDSADVVLIDTPPALVVSDASALSPSLDGVILVVRTGKTRLNSIRQAVEQFRQVNARVLGIVLNDTNPKAKYNRYQNYYGKNTKGDK